MSRFSRVLLFLTWCFILCFVSTGVAQAGGVLLHVAEEYMFHVDPTGTDWQTSFDVPQYNPADHDGADLVEVMLILGGESDSSFQASPIGGDATIQSGSLGALITATSPDAGLGAINVSAWPLGTIAPPPIEIQDGTIEVIIDILGDDEGMQTLGGLAAFVGAGTYQVDVDATETLGLVASGADLNTNTSTLASAWLTVQYKVVWIPEPSMLALGLTGMIGLIAVRRRGS